MNQHVLAERPVVVAHRGASVEAPENTLAAFRRALELGAPAMELDVHRTADGELVVIHDATVDRTTNGTGVAEATLEAYGGWTAWKGDAFEGERIPPWRECRLARGARPSWWRSAAESPIRWSPRSRRRSAGRASSSPSPRDRPARERSAQGDRWPSLRQGGGIRPRLPSWPRCFLLHHAQCTGGDGARVQCGEPPSKRVDGERRGWDAGWRRSVPTITATTPLWP